MTRPPVESRTQELISNLSESLDSRAELISNLSVDIELNSQGQMLHIDQDLQEILDEGAPGTEKKQIEAVTRPERHNLFREGLNMLSSVKDEIQQVKNIFKGISVRPQSNEKYNGSQDVTLGQELKD